MEIDIFIFVYFEKILFFSILIQSDKTNKVMACNWSFLTNQITLLKRQQENQTF